MWLIVSERHGSHGSMTKAGKVKFYQTPKVRKTGVNGFPKKIPRMRFRDVYNKRIVDRKYGGQPNSIGAKKHKRMKRND